MRLGHLILASSLLVLPCSLLAQSSTGKALGAPRVEKVTEETMSVAGFVPSQSRGVFIGINDFADESVADLKFACDDAVDLAYRFYELGLIRPEGIALGLAGEPIKSETKAKVATLRERGMPEPFSPEKSNILKVLGAASKGAGREGLLVLTLSTHGFYEGGDALLARDTTVDLDLDSGILTETSLSYDSLVALMLRSPSPRRLALVDACRERLRQGGTKSLARDPALPTALAERLARTKGIAMVLGAPPGGYGYDGGQDDTNQPIQNGVFTHYLLKGLSGDVRGDTATGVVTLGALLDYTQSHLSRWTSANGRPVDDGGSGISFRELDRALMELPLALDAGRAERLREVEKRRVRSRELLAQAFAAEPNIVTAVVLGEVTQALSEWDAERVEPLVAAIERLEVGTPESRRYFVKVDWEDLRPRLATPTPTPLPTPVSISAANTTGARTVAPDGSGVYTTISAAMAEASAGETVTVKPGTYRELVVLRSGVRLVGSGPETTRIEVPSGHRSALLAVDCEGAIVENLTIDGVGFKNISAWSPGFGLAYESGQMVTDAVNPDGPAAGLGIGRGTKVTRFAGREPVNGDQWPLAFEFGAAALNRALDLEVELNGARQSYSIEPRLLPVVDEGATITGVALLRSSVTLSNVVVQNFTGDGVHLAGRDASLTARKLTVTGNGRHGVMALQGSELVTEDCIMRENKSAGIFVSGQGTRADIRTATVTANGSSGIYAIDSGNATVLRSIISDNGGAGVRATQAGSRLSLNDCQIQRNTKEGGAVTDGAELIVDYCIVEENKGDGLGASKAGSRITVINSNMRLNKERGLLVGSGAVGRVEGSLAHLNDKGGIRLGDTREFSVSNTTVTNNTGDGLSISSGTRATLTKVSADKNNEDGFAIWGEGTEVTLKECTAKGSARYGFFLGSSGTADFANCIATENGKNGFAFGEKTNATLADCESHKHPESGFAVWSGGVATATRCVATEATTGFSAGTGSLFTVKECVSDKCKTRGYIVFGAGGRMMATGCRALNTEASLAVQSDSGFVVATGASGEYIACEATDVKETGFFAYGEGSSMTVRNSTASGSRYGIWLQDMAGGSITENNVRNATQWGIGLNGEGTRAEVRNNTLTGNANNDQISIGGGARNTAE